MDRSKIALQNISKIKSQGTKEDIKLAPSLKSSEKHSSLQTLSKFCTKRNGNDEDVKVGADFIRGYYSDSEVKEITKVKFEK